MTAKLPEVNLNAADKTNFRTVDDLIKFVEEEPFRYPKLRQEAATEIIWADSVGKKTPYALVYIHGFTASKGEGDPVHRRIAQEFGMNAFLARLPQHGLDDQDAFMALTPDAMIASAAQAIKAASLLGEKVIVMATSTGATLALIQAAQGADIEALVLYSPLIDFFDNRMDVFSLPRGRILAEQIIGGKYMQKAESEKPLANKVWYTTYHINGLEALAALVEHSMKPALFSKVKQPVFLGYYYKDEQNQDQTVSVSAMLEMFDALGTTKQNRLKKAYPEAGAHVISSTLTSGSVEEVIGDTRAFLQGLGLQTIAKTP
jgi:pimeloyl-ACP methyl ester carboxylesterase